MLTTGARRDPPCPGFELQVLKVSSPVLLTTELSNYFLQMAPLSLWLVFTMFLGLPHKVGTICVDLLYLKWPRSGSNKGKARRVAQTRIGPMGH